MASPKHSANRRKFSREPLDIDDLMSASSFSGIRDVIESHFGKPDAPAATPVLETDPTRLQYVWEPKEAPISLRIGVDLIERLEKESLEIFRAITNRGSEIGGILLGQVVHGAPLTVVVEDYEPVPCAYSLGPTFRLSEEEQQNLREMIARWRATGHLTVGFFRSNTRPTLALTEEDLALFHGFFPEDRNVFLLAKPFSRKPSRGAVFVREGRKIRSESSYLEFPFSKSELEKSGALQPAIRVVRQTEPAGPASEGDRVAITPPAAAPSKPGPQEPAAALDGKSEPPQATEAKIEPQVPASPVAESEPVLRRTPEAEPRVEPPPAPLPRSQDRVQPRTKSESKVVAPAPPPVEVGVTSEPAAVPAAPFEDFQFAAAAEPQGRRRWLLGVAAVAVIGGIGLLAVFSSGRSAPSAARTPASAVRPEQAMLALRVQGAESGLMIEWDPLAPAISAARGGRLTITERGVPNRFNLSADDLKTGHYIYKPRADDLAIRLELDGQPPGQNVFGLARVLGVSRMLPPASRR